MFPTKTQLAPSARQASDTETWHTHGAPSPGPGHWVEHRAIEHVHTLEPGQWPLRTLLDNSLSGQYSCNSLDIHHVTCGMWHGGLTDIIIGLCLKVMLGFQFSALGAILKNHA